jgi:SAM-dependent methyltransferase
MSTDPGPSLDVTNWASELRGNWETLARSRYRDYFVASHRGCDDPEVWKAQARYDAEVVLHELDSGSLSRADILEIGCGVGRLAGVLAPRVRSFTGIDIAPAMIAEAQRRGGELSNARFLLGDGTRVPDGARDRRYALAFALAVFIHCPKVLIAALIRDAWELLTPEGELRFQLRAEASDPTGIAPISEAPLQAVPPELPNSAPRPDEVAGMREVSALIEGHYYMGHAFRFAEVAPFLAEAVPSARPRILRFDPHHLYVDLRR